MYPFLVTIRKITGRTIIENTRHQMGVVPFHSLSVQLNNGQPYDFKNLQGKKILLVNTASDCGFTQQYAALQTLYQKSGGQLVIIGFPANDFKEQEKGSDEEILLFCEKNFGVTFPLAKKSKVIKSENQHPVFNWLTHKNMNGWNDKQPSWNFSKYLVNEEGMLTHYFDASISPLSRDVWNAIHTTNDHELNQPQNA